jgi:hypothetical protein
MQIACVEKHHSYSAKTNTNTALQQMQQTDLTHPVCGILVGAGIKQQPRAVRVTFLHSQKQRRHSILRACANRPPPQMHTTRTS